MNFPRSKIPFRNNPATKLFVSENAEKLNGLFVDVHLMVFLSLFGSSSSYHLLSPPLSSGARSRLNAILGKIASVQHQRGVVAAPTCDRCLQGNATKSPATGRAIDKYSSVLKCRH